LNRENDEFGWDFLTMAWRHTRGKDAAHSVDDTVAISSGEHSVAHAIKSLEPLLPSETTHQSTSAVAMQTAMQEVL
jgi:hypothetical protein